ncbi:hypothetical protein [Methylobacterium sp. J-068]|uniref:hypothetical protein n=1 Tax=Methylobacterium sp. J-068 TaxID=2836649 RepID=UPI001FB86B91|nr:hypothetical protein [Methylobacterium sp. J-068]MCJ2034615.1 hypothetical protein [Methylobacterium sp. J-068]
MSTIGVGLVLKAATNAPASIPKPCIPAVGVSLCDMIDFSQDDIPDSDDKLGSKARWSIDLAKDEH